MNRTKVVAGVAAVLIIVVAIVFWRSRDDSAPDSAQAPTQSEQLESQAESAGAESTDTESQASSADSGSADSSAADVTEAPASDAPSFDIVRVEPSGETVIAGRAQPGSEVEVLSGETTLGKATANETGEWVLIPEQPLEPGGHELSLQSVAPVSEPAAENSSSDEAASETDEEASAPKITQSDQVVMVVVPEKAETTDAGEEATEPEIPLALLTTRSGDSGTKILQGPNEGISDHQLVLNALDYDDRGRVIISGRGMPGALLIIYLDGIAIGRTKANAEGHWQLVPKAPIAAGLHTLRVDMVGEAGEVLARVETPFERVAAAEVIADAESGKSFVVVQPGNSLWRISRSTYGQGTRYTVIFKANQNQIRDPHLIYPGQIFVIPSQ